MSETDKKKIENLEGHGLHIPVPSDVDPDPAVNRMPADDVYTGQEYRSSSQKQEEKTPSIGRDITILVMITLAAGVLLGAAYSVTKAPIARAQAKARAEAQRTVMEGADSFRVMYSGSQDGGEAVPEEFEDALDEAGIDTTDITQIDVALNKDEEIIGYVVTTKNPDGYGGDVEVMSGITTGDDTVTIEGISFLSLSETAGMGMRAKEDEFISQFNGKEIGGDELLIYTKSGAEEANEIDAISGCTITTSAVTDNVNAALIAVSQAAGQSDAEEAGNEQTDADGSDKEQSDAVGSDKEQSDADGSDKEQSDADGSDKGQEESE